jgi:hypothetical protein
MIFHSLVSGKRCSSSSSEQDLLLQALDVADGFEHNRERVRGRREGWDKVPQGLKLPGDHLPLPVSADGRLGRLLQHLLGRPVGRRRPLGRGGGGGVIAGAYVDRFAHHVVSCLLNG